MNRQVDGFQGRPNKPIDTCYSFWVGGALKILDVYDLISFSKNEEFVLSTQHDIIGGMSKWLNVTPDPLHTYMGLAGLSLMNYQGLNKIMPELNITYRTLKHLKQLQRSWNVYQ